MIPDWQKNKIYFSDRLKTTYASSHANIVNALHELNITPQYLTGTKDIWARDYMPIQIQNTKFIEYRYDPDYLQGKRKGFRDIKTYPDIVCKINGLPETVKSDLIIDGGNMVKSSNHIILTDKVAFENRLTKGETISELKRTFEVDHVILIPWIKNEMFGHSDGIVRFIDEKSVLLHEFDKYNSPLIKKLLKYKIDIKWLEFDVFKKNKLSWGYLNFLQIDNAMLVPKLDIDEDEQAFNQIKHHFKKYIDEKRIRQVAIKDIVESGGGGLNCISWTIKE